MRAAILLSILATLVAGCDQPSRPKTTKPKATAKARAATPGKSAAAPPRPVPRPATPAKPVPDHRAAVKSPAAERWLVVSVHDGDTVLCLDGGNTQRKVRLLGIDAPEIGQPFGTKSRDGLRALVLRKSVLVHEHGEDRYGRTLGSLEVDGGDVALLMLSSGLAWHFTRYSDDEVRAAAESEARAARRGLWADREPVPPWDWRATERDRKAAARQPTGG